MTELQRATLISHLKRYKFMLLAWFDTKEGQEADESSPLYKRIAEEVAENQRLLVLLEQGEE